MLYSLRTWWDLVRGGWRLWPQAQLVGYTLIPLPHRVLWVDTVELAWASIMSMHGSHERARAVLQARGTLPLPAKEARLPRL